MLLRKLMMLLSPADGAGGGAPSASGAPAATGPGPAPATVPSTQGAGPGTAQPSSSAGGDWNEFLDLGADDASSPPSAREGLAGPPPAPGGEQPAGAVTQATTSTEIGPSAATPLLPTGPVPVQQPPQEVPAQAAGEEPAFNPYDPGWQAGQIEALAPHFALSEEQANQMMTEPGVVLPQLAARLMLQTRLEVAHLMSEWGKQIIPEVFGKMLDARQSQQTTQSAVQEHVFKPFPKLAEVPQDQLASMAKVIRGRMPQATPQQRLNALAQAAYGLFGWTLPQASRPQAVAQAAASGAPPASPFMPVVTGAAPPLAPTPNGRDDNNPWAQFLE